mgnify:CR=1 FL=1
MDMVMFRPFPADLVSKIVRGRKGVSVLERLDQPLAVDLPLIRLVAETGKPMIISTGLSDEDEIEAEAEAEAESEAPAEPVAEAAERPAETEESADSAE